MKRTVQTGGFLNRRPRTTAALGIFAAALAATICIPASAATADGFVTALNSQTSFDVGSIRVDLGVNTRCEVQPTYPLTWKKSLYGPTQEVRFQTPHSSKPLPATCSVKLLSVGSKVHLVGSMRNLDGHFLATNVKVYAIRGEGKLENGALLEEPLEIHPEGGGSLGTLWIDGYPVRVTAQTKLLAAPDDTTFRYRFHDPLVVHARQPSGGDSSGSINNLDRANIWVIYHATRGQAGSITANQLRYWRNQDSPQKHRYRDLFVPKIIPPDYANLQAGAIQFKQGDSIAIIPSKMAQEWVSALGKSLVPSYIRSLPDADGTKTHFRFFVVRPFPSVLGDYFVETKGLMPRYELLHWDSTTGTFYRKPEQGGVVRNVVASPDGTIMVPDCALSSLHNSAQLAAVLSDAITTVLQEHGYLGQPSAMITYTLARNVGSYYIGGDPAMIALWQSEQVLRIGIRQMLLAGFDIREAPFAWAAELGSAASNPVMNARRPDDDLPGFAAYAFDYINHYYADADYSKLKRGEAEYAALLEELRKADPSLPSPKMQP